MDADLAKAMMSINAVKAVEIGDGFAGAAVPGEEAHDTMHMEDGAMVFDSNRAGGTLGGITNGEPLVVRFAVKPTSSLPRPQPTVTVGGEDATAVHQGPARSLRRHPRRAGRRGHDGLRPRRPLAAPPGAAGAVGGGSDRRIFRTGAGSHSFTRILRCRLHSFITRYFIIQFKSAPRTLSGLIPV